MLFPPPDQDLLYRAFLSRDEAYEGRWYVGVTSTGVFCRFSCPARKPKREHCRFYETIAACLESGFRPCKRCRPLRSAATVEPVVRDLVAALERNPAHRWTEGEIEARGFDPSTVRRAFKRRFGITFLELARMQRIREGFTTLSAGGQVIDAQLDAGFSSPSGFRDAFARLLGRSPAAFHGTAHLKADWIDTPLGPMIAVGDRHALHLLEFADRKALPTELRRLYTFAKGDVGLGRYEPIDQVEAELQRFFAARSATFSVRLVLHGSAFTRGVWQALRRIPVGETRSYGQIAAELHHPSATRAVARANGANRIALLIPCHRVIGADGSLTGYGGGLWRKRYLIDLERRLVAAAP